MIFKVLTAVALIAAAASVEARPALRPIVNNQIVPPVRVPPEPAVDAVPEPASWAMMVAGFGLVGFAVRSRRRSIAA